MELDFKEQLKEMNVEEWFVVSINDLLLSVKLVEKDKDRKNIKTPYVKIELLVPHDIAVSVPQFLKSDYRLALFGFKVKDKEVVTNE
ncbi:MAG: hypothetical protein AABY22_08115 [Nanoarchaeota archaeon]